MKIKNALFLVVIAIAGSACNSKSGDSTDADSLSSNITVENQECYLAVDGIDTAYLNIDYLANGKIAGTMLINYNGKPNNDGDLTGEFKGDTLYADYTFTIGENKTVNKNPLAFLRDSAGLSLGVGQIETHLGRSYFVKGQPINFDRGRFKFTVSECE